MRNEDAKALLRDVRRMAGDLEAMVPTPDGPKPLVIFARDRLALQADRSIPGKGTEGGAHGAGDHSDPTLAAASDEASRIIAARIKAARDELDDAIRTAAQRLERALKLAQAAAVTKYHAPRNNPGCANCRRVTLHDGTPHPEAWQEVKARGLCGWCYRFEHGDGRDAPGYGVAPVLELVAWHLDHLGTNPPRTLIRDLMPDEYRAREELRRRIASRDTHPAGDTFAAPREDFDRHVHATSSAVES